MVQLSIKALKCCLIFWSIPFKQLTLLPSLLCLPLRLLIGQGLELAAIASDVQLGPDGLREGQELLQGFDHDDRPTDLGEEAGAGDVGLADGGVRRVRSVGVRG